MFKITPIQTGEEQERLLSLCGSHAKKGQFSYLMFDLETGAPMGVSQFEILGKDGVLSDLLPAPGTDDTEAMFILGRQTLNFMDLCGITECTAAPGAGDEALLHLIGFRKEGGRLTVRTTGMFDGHCGGHKVSLS